MKPLLLFLTGLISTGFFLIEAKNLPEDQVHSNNAAAYITVWKTNNPGISNNKQVLIPAEGDFTYLWNEVDNVTNNGSGTGSGPTTITFPEPGTYRLHITPTGSNPFHRIEFGDEHFSNPTNDRLKLLKVEQWGDVVWSSFYKAYNLCRNIDFTAGDTPNLSNVTDMSFAFWDTDLDSINKLNNWDVSNVTNMRYLFADNPNFNQNIENWDVSKVTDMEYIFVTAKNFDQSLAKWNLKSLGTGEADEDWFSDYDDEIPEGPIFSFYNSGMSCENYSHTLFGWANNPDTPEELKVDMRDMEYAPIVEEFRDYLINNLNWEMEGDTLGDCVIVLSSEKQDFTGFQFYPNPVQSHLFLSADKIMDNIRLYNISGQRIMEVQPKSEIFTLNTDAFTPGIYLMEVKIEEMTKVYRLVKQ